MFILIAVCSIAYILEVWFNTEAFIEYATVLDYTEFFKIEDYLLLKDKGFNEGYLAFLKLHFDCLLVRIVTCPTCLSFWLSFFLCLGSFHLFYTLSIAFLALLFYRVLSKLG